MELKDKVVLITGSTRGIGNATALAFLRAGSKVILHGRRSLSAEEGEKLKDFQDNYTFITADLANPDDVQQLADSAWQAYGHIDVVVNNAGMNKDKLLVAMKQSDFDNVINVNLRGTFLLTKAILKKMYKQKSGCFVNITSVVGIHGNVGQANYAASKAGIIGLTKTVAQEGALRGIRSNAVSPGMIASDMTAALSERNQKRIVDQIPLKRLGKPEEVAQAVLFLAQNDYMTGQTIVIDGGMTI